MFALTFVPFALLPDDLGLWLWEGLAIASFLAGVAILPVRAGVRWGVLLLGALDWPLLYAVKLGQVGPLLFLLFAVGWRCLDRAVPLGLSMAAGAMIKVQPLILLVWAGLTGRWRAVGVAVGGPCRRGARRHDRVRAGRLGGLRRAAAASQLPGDDAAQLHARRGRLPGRDVRGCRRRPPGRRDGRRWSPSSSSRSASRRPRSAT